MSAIPNNPIGWLLLLFVLKRARNQGRESDLFASLELTSDPVLELEFHLHDDDDEDDDDDDSDDSDDDGAPSLPVASPPSVGPSWPALNRLSALYLQQ